MTNRKRKLLSGVRFGRILRMERLESRIQFAADLTLDYSDPIADSAVAVWGTTEVLDLAYSNLFDDIQHSVPSMIGVTAGIDVELQQFGRATDYVIDEPMFGFGDSIRDDVVASFLEPTSAPDTLSNSFLISPIAVDLLFQDLFDERVTVLDMDMGGNAIVASSVSPTNPSFFAVINEPFFAVEVLGVSSREIGRTFAFESLQADDLSSSVPSANDAEQVSPVSAISRVLTIDSLFVVAERPIDLAFDLPSSHPGIVRSTSVAGSNSGHDSSMLDVTGLEGVAWVAPSSLMADITQAAFSPSKTRFGELSVVAAFNKSLDLDPSFPLRLGPFHRVDFERSNRANRHQESQYKTLSEMIDQSGIDVDFGDQLSLERREATFVQGNWHASRSPSLSKVAFENGGARFVPENLIGMLAIGGEVGLGTYVDGQFHEVDEDFVVQTRLICDDLHSTFLVTTEAPVSESEIDDDSTVIASRELPLAAVGGVILIFHATLLPRRPSRKSLVSGLLREIGSLTKHGSKKPL